MTTTIKILRAGAAKRNPFTICILANPWLEAPWRSGSYIPDPIIGNLASFQAAAAYIDAALFALLPGQTERLLADPAIEPHIRVVSIYDDALPLDTSYSLVAQDSVSDTLIAQRTAFGPFLDSYGYQADVAYAVSASSTHTRASAWFTSDDDTKAGVQFDLDGTKLFHRYENLIPGTVAIHFTATSLTALHEFGHAISSYSNGKIVDLYVDSSAGLNNKRGRPIPANFGSYNGAVLRTDPLRDTLGYPPTWSSYHCALVDAGCPAVMDDYWRSTKGPVACRHDSITAQFIRDRVLAKIGRP